MKKLLSCILIICFILSLCTFANAESSPDRFETPSFDKMSEDVLAFIETAEDDDILDVYVIFEDVDEDTVMQAFAMRYPEEYAEYMKACECDVPPEIIAGDEAKLGEEVLRDDLNKDFDGELLQAGIEKKREVFREFYTEKNEGILYKFVPENQVMYCGKYAPMAIVRATKQQLIALAEESPVLGLDIFEDKEAVCCYSIAYQTTNIIYLRDTCGNSGSTVKIGQLEAQKGIPDTTDSELSSATIYRDTTTGVVHPHATTIAKILVGNHAGVSPSATLYCRGFQTQSQYYGAVEYLLNQGVNVINYSGGTEIGASYSYPEIWTDHIARQHDVHFVVAAGNYTGSDYGYQIYSPGMAYNAITVGSYFTHFSDTNTDDTMWADSCWERSGIIAEKPNLIAPGEHVIIPGDPPDWHSGTSISTPMVAGTIADLCSYYYPLKVKQTAIGAIMAASCTYKIDGQQGQGIYGDSFSNNSYRVENNPQINKKEGAGKLNAKAARYIVTTAQWWGTTVNASNLPYSQTVYIDSSSNSLIRVALFWLRRISISGTHDQNSTLNGENFSNLNLQVLGPNGNIVASSTTSYSNFEIVQFAPTITGNYTIKVSRASGTSTLENIGLAVY